MLKKSRDLKVFILMKRRYSAVVIDALIDVLAFSIGSLNNPTKIAKTFDSNGIKIADKTISTYIDYLMDACLFH